MSTERKKTITELNRELDSKFSIIIQQYSSSFKRYYINLFWEKHREEAIKLRQRTGAVAYGDVVGRFSGDDVRNYVARPLLKDIISSLCGSNRVDHSLEGLEKIATDKLFNKHVEKIMRHFEDIESDYYRSRSASARAKAEFDGRCLREGGIAQFF